MIEFNITGTIIIYTVFDYEDVAFVADKDLIKHSENGYMYKITPLKAMSMLYPYLWALTNDQGHARKVYPILTRYDQEALLPLQ